MASVNSFNSNQELVQYLKKTGKITSDLVFNVMSKVDRKHFTTQPSLAYVDKSHVVAFQQSISSAHMHAITLELVAAKLQSGGRVLDIGSGTGYLTACMAMAVGKKEKAIGIDCVAKFRDMAKKTVEENYSTLENCIEFVVGDGRSGYAAMAPYDVIIVGAADDEIPITLIEQLGNGGRLIMPVKSNGQCQVLMQVDKAIDGTITKTEIMDVIYESLTDVKEFEILWPDVKENIAVLMKRTKKLQEKLNSVELKICNECKTRNVEVTNLSQRIEQLERIFLEANFETLHTKLSSLVLDVEKINYKCPNIRVTHRFWNATCTILLICLLTCVVLIYQIVSSAQHFVRNSSNSFDLFFNDIGFGIQPT